MKRFLVPVLILTFTLLLSACGGKGGSNKQENRWGVLQVSLEKIQPAEKQWSANLAVKNPTNEMQLLQYRGQFRYSLVITKEGKEVAHMGFGEQDPKQGQTVNLAAGVSKEHFVVWTYRDDSGQKVAPGDYEATVTLNAVTVVRNPQAKPGQQEQVIKPITVGPVKITVK